MNNIHIRQDIHHLVDRLANAQVLQAVHIILSNQALVERDFWQELSPEKRQDIEKGLDDLKDGKKKLYKDVLAKYGL